MMQEEQIKAFEQALEEAWKSYTDRGSATVDALEENTQELAFAKGFKVGVEWQKSRLIDRACEWLRTRVFTYESDFFEDFKKTMEEQQ